MPAFVCFHKQHLFNKHSLRFRAKLRLVGTRGRTRAVPFKEILQSVIRDPERVRFRYFSIVLPHKRIFNIKKKSVHQQSKIVCENPGTQATNARASVKVTEITFVFPHLDLSLKSSLVSPFWFGLVYKGDVSNRFSHVSREIRIFHSDSNKITTERVSFQRTCLCHTVMWSCDHAPFKTWHPGACRWREESGLSNFSWG